MPLLACSVALNVAFALRAWREHAPADAGARVGDWWDRLADWSASAAGVTVLLVLSTFVLLFAFLEVG